jgi:hypothetical protein
MDTKRRKPFGLGIEWVKVIKLETKNVFVVNKKSMKHGLVNAENVFEG